MAKDPSLQEFDQTEYLRCSENNMPRWTPMVPLDESEQSEVDAALAI
jgi:hypothetical protein